MSDILVLTQPRDFHSYAVAEGLRRKGVGTVLWHGTDFPSRQVASVEVLPDDWSLEVRGTDLHITSARFDTVWNRRLCDPVLPDTLHPSDVFPARRDCQHFLWSLWHVAGPDAFWVNPLTPIPSAILKPYQLPLAQKVGLRVPETLCSNDPRKIESFLEDHQDVIYKSFHSGSWKTEEGVLAQFTAKVSRDDLPDDDVLQASPGIFQVRVPKAHELRVTFFGDLAVTARLHSQENPLGQEDWRAAFSTLDVEPDTLPDEVEARCRRLMRELNLVFGCFDFIVTPDGEHVFLELNPMGQFLFLERLCPELPLLELFTELLIRRDPRGPDPVSSPSLRLKDVWDVAEEQHVESAEKYVQRPPKVVAEDEPEQEADMAAAASAS